jgi:ribonuclease E
MSQNKMLIDATHKEETRVVVVRGNRVEEFDFESQNKAPLKGNIYLAKITRVEPSLQACFVEYGGNRHGFLAFSEIHPDYYQIPVADREALLAEEAEAARREDEGDDEKPKRFQKRRKRGKEAAKTVDSETISEELTEAAEHADGVEPTAMIVEDEAEEEEQIEQLGESDSNDDAREMRMTPLRRKYKIQDVIRRKQVVLIQVVKEERGNKGAAVTTYLSLAGRYSVLMPNTARGGGISRKITQGGDRKRLKEVVGELDVPQGMGVILRTAGANRTGQEIKRDFEYLLRVWETIRDLTLKSHAPQLVHEEGSLIKRSIRDLYGKEVDEVWVAGEEGYAEARDFMKMLMPTHAKNVVAYREPASLFARFGVEQQLDAMYSTTVTLKSGGYIVLNQTEALVAVDVNSGKATKEHHIEDTALKTNLEAADEVARQLRLRDLAGLIVVDFIDMEEHRNNRTVEKRLKDALKNDRARIQVGRISHFGLLEMSRQRLRSGMMESSSEKCAHCMGSGIVRSKASVALHILRALEEHLLKNPLHNVILTTRQDVALYILNVKRGHIAALELQYKVTIEVVVGETDGAHLFTVSKGEQVLTPESAYRPEITKPKFEASHEEGDVEEEIEAEVEEVAPAGETEEEGRNRRNRRKRNRRRNKGDRSDATPVVSTEEFIDYNPDAPVVIEAETVVEEVAAPEKRTRGRRKKDVAVEAVVTEEAAVSEEVSEGEEPKRGLRRGKYGRLDRRPRRDREEGETASEPKAIEVKFVEPAPTPVSVVAPPVVIATPVAEVEAPAPRQRRLPDPEPIIEAPVTDAPVKKGWWRR